MRRALITAVTGDDGCSRAFPEFAAKIIHIGTDLGRELFLLEDGTSQVGIAANWS